MGLDAAYIIVWSYLKGYRKYFLAIKLSLWTKGSYLPISYCANAHFKIYILRTHWTGVFVCVYISPHMLISCAAAVLFCALTTVSPSQQYKRNRTHQSRQCALVHSKPSPPYGLLSLRNQMSKKWIFSAYRPKSVNIYLTCYWSGRNGKRYFLDLKYF